MDLDALLVLPYMFFIKSTPCEVFARMVVALLVGCGIGKAYTGSTKNLLLLSLESMVRYGS